MPHIEKTSGVKATGFKELSSLIKRYSKSDKLKSNTDSLFGDGGLAGMIGSKLVGKKLSGKIGSGFRKAQEKIIDTDIKLGNKAHNLIKNDKGGKRDKLSNLFMDKKKFEVGGTKKGKPAKHFEVDVPGLLTPVSKAKNVALPLAGSLYLSSKLYGDENKKEGGEQKLAQNKDKLIHKVSSQLNHNPSDIDEQNFDNAEIAKIAMAASKVLKKAASNQRVMEEKLGQLEKENFELKKEAEMNDKYIKAEKLAHHMNEKGMIKKADIDAQIQQLVELDETGFSVLKEAVEKTPTKTASEGLDNLTFLGTESNINSRDRKKTLADSLETAD